MAENVASEGVESNFSSVAFFLAPPLGGLVVIFQDDLFVPAAVVEKFRYVRRCYPAFSVARSLSIEHNGMVDHWTSVRRRF